jgi:hygromycin-B 7''-O-kinase
VSEPRGLGARPDDDHLVRLAGRIASRHGLGAVRLRYARGSCPVFAVGPDPALGHGSGHVIKLFETRFRRNFDTEVEVLGHVHGKLGVPTPALRQAGELEGWLYVVMEEMQGSDLRSAWERIPGPDRRRLATELGGALFRLHALPTGSLTAARAGWDVFIAEQRRGCVAHQARQGVDARWLAQIPAYLSSVRLDAPARPVLLHTEIMREHVLVSEHGGVWRLSGLIDFEPATLGHPEYELASVGLFLAEGDAEILGAVVAGHGELAMTAELSRRCMAYALVHRYSNLRWYLDRMPVRPGTTTLDELAEQWWPVRD